MARGVGTGELVQPNLTPSLTASDGEGGILLLEETRGCPETLEFN